MSGQVISSVLSAIAVLVLTAIARLISGMRRDMRVFMQEHLYLLAIADWSRTTIATMTDHMGIHVTSPPELPKRGK